MQAYGKALDLKPNYVRCWVNMGIAQAYKKVYALKFNRLAIAKLCVTYSRLKGVIIPDDMARWKTNAQSYIWETENLAKR